MRPRKSNLPFGDIRPCRSKKLFEEKSRANDIWACNRTKGFPRGNYNRRESVLPYGELCKRKQYQTNGRKPEKNTCRWKCEYPGGVCGACCRAAYKRSRTQGRLQPGYSAHTTLWSKHRPAKDKHNFNSCKR